MSKLPIVQNLYLQNVLIKVRVTNGEYISTYAFLDIGSKSTLIRSKFAKRLNLWENSKLVNISSIKDSGELINVDEVELYVTDEVHTSSFHINKALAIKRGRFNMPAQLIPIHYQKNGEKTHLQGLKLANINPSDVMEVICADVPEVFIQLDIWKGKEGEPLTIKTPFCWKIFESSKKCSATETKKVVVNTTIIKWTWVEWWELDSMIAESVNESCYSQKDVKCIKKLH